MKALEVWRRFPRQIASDLRRFFGCHIRDWHQGQMSSFELMELFGASVTDDPEAQTRTIRIDFAPEDGAVAMALRDGERPEWKQMLAQSANIAILLRQYHAPDADTDKYGGEQFFLPIWRQREEAEHHDFNPSDDDAEPGGLYAQWQVQEVN